MAPSTCNSWFCVLAISLLLGLATSSPYITYEALGAHAGPGRTLLQLKSNCNISFQDMDYSILTNQCKGPQYQAKLCCNALKEFACPYTDSLNDPSSDCATTMFSYINLYGKYPPGLFANECREGKEGLDCDNMPQSKTKNGAAHISATTTTSSLLMLAAGILLFHLL